MKHSNLLLTNNSIVDLEDIMVDDDESRLFCLTNTASCCRGSDTGSDGVGVWYLPDGTEAPGGARESGFRRDRGTSFVALARGPDENVPTGLFRCEIPDAEDVMVTVIAGIYRTGEGSQILEREICFISDITGMPIVDPSLPYNFTAQTLTCISTGGPATDVTWYRDNVLISDSQSTTEQQLTEISTATYRNLLTLTSSNIRDYSGSFSCNVSNSRGSDTQEVTLRREFE